MIKGTIHKLDIIIHDGIICYKDFIALDTN